jgi:hypothetical protein
LIDDGLGALAEDVARDGAGLRLQGEPFAVLGAAYARVAEALRLVDRMAAGRELSAFLDVGGRVN